MDIDTAATFFVGSILIGLGVIIVAMVILLLNNLFNKFWKPVKFSIYQIPQYTYVDPPMDNVATANTETTANTTIKVKNAGRQII
jgi:hypothetical protein